VQRYGYPVTDLELLLIISLFAGWHGKEFAALGLLGSSGVVPTHFLVRKAIRLISVLAFDYTSGVPGLHSILIISVLDNQCQRVSPCEKRFRAIAASSYGEHHPRVALAGRFLQPADAVVFVDLQFPLCNEAR